MRSECSGVRAMFLAVGLGFWRVRLGALEEEGGGILEGEEGSLEGEEGDGAEGVRGVEVER